MSIKKFKLQASTKQQQQKMDHRNHSASANRVHHYQQSLHTNSRLTHPASAENNQYIVRNLRVSSGYSRSLNRIRQHSPMYNRWRGRDHSLSQSAGSRKRHRTADGKLLLDGREIHKYPIGVYFLQNIFQNNFLGLFFLSRRTTIKNAGQLNVQSTLCTAINSNV
jgi:hypothetical protein